MFNIHHRRSSQLLFGSSVLFAQKYSCVLKQQYHDPIEVGPDYLIGAKNLIAVKFTEKSSDFDTFIAGFSDQNFYFQNIF